MTLRRCVCVCRFELCEEDRGLLKGLKQQGDRSEELLQEVLRRMGRPSPSDLREARRELISADMEAKERDYLMEQICALLESSAVTAPAASAAGKGDSLSPRPSFNILGDTPLLNEAPELI